MRRRASEVSRVRPMPQIYRPVCLVSSPSCRFPVFGQRPVGATAGTASALHSAEGGKAKVLVQDFHLGEPDLTQQVQLKQQRARRVFLLDVGEYMIASGPSTVADWPVSRFENRSTSASNRRRISSTVDINAAAKAAYFPPK